MATNLESETGRGNLTLPHASLKVVGLHINGLRSIGSLDLPGDGLGWDGPMPDVVTIGGVNGGGKTTLLEFLAGALDQLGRPPLNFAETIPGPIHAREASLDLRIELPDGAVEVRFLVGDREFLDRHATENWYGFEYHHGGDRPDPEVRFRTEGELAVRLRAMLFHGGGQVDDSSPGVVYFPSEERSLLIPDTSYKAPGKVAASHDFVHRWSVPARWNDSLEAWLYGLRWEDLNAKEEGRTAEAGGFDAYSLAFDRFFEGRKQLKWRRGELVVETRSGDVHDLSALSSGEKQVILFMGELLRRWRPGSLILIDEPELHLHESFQTKLWVSLLEWQGERGGQVVVATQSGHLFQLAAPDTKVLLGGRRSR